MKNILTLLFLVFFCNNAISQIKVITKENPSWLIHQDYSTTPNINYDDLSDGTLMLLADYQVHIPTQQYYYRFTTKITDNVGIQSASNINVSYDPLYQKLIFHKLTITRDNQIINKLNANDFQVIRRELNAENYLYDGSLSAMINLSDVRTNDIIDCSYSIIGFNPIHNNKYSDIFYLNDNVPIGKIHVALFTKNDINYKTINTDIQPEISVKNGLNNYQWTVNTPEKFDYEDAIPAWKMTYPTLVISDYDSWEEVVHWGNNTYNSNYKIDKALALEISEIGKKYKTEGEKIKAILNFVQNDIRYLGYELGIGSYKPNNPNKVFKQRFGDCKDKSLLMVTMLNQLGIESYPMLLNTYLKHTIKEELLPSPIFFDHCVVKVIDNAETILYYDPTSTNQGGTFKNTHFPNYEFGLVLKPGVTDFDTIISKSSNTVTTNEEYILEDINKGAILNVVTTYTDGEADNMRNYFKNNGINSISKEYEDFYSNYYFNIKSTKIPEFTDNLIDNEFTTFEAYKMDSIWSPMQFKEDHISATFTPASLIGLLYIPTKENRKYEVDLVYPVSRQHNFKIKLPEPWHIENMNELVSSDIFYYDWEVKYNKKKNEVDVKSYLKIQNSYIKPNEFKQYQNDINKADKSFGFTLFIPKDEINSNASSINPMSNNVFKFLFFWLILAILTVLIIWFYYKRKKN